MFEFIYETLLKFGYTHPLHPTLTHLPIGLVLGSFVFGLIAIVYRKSALITTARHCAILAPVTVPLAVLLGLMDWQHFYGGAWIFSIKMKLALAACFSVFFLLALLTYFRKYSANNL